MNCNKVKMIGEVELILCDQFGEIKERVEVKNLVVAVGKNWIASRMVGTTDATMTHMSIGTGSTTPSVGNTSLSSEVGRVVLTNTSRTNNQITFGAFFAAGTGSGNIHEAGIFNSGVLGTMLCRTVFTTINKDILDTLTINWTVTVL